MKKVFFAVFCVAIISVFAIQFVSCEKKSKTPTIVGTWKCIELNGYDMTDDNMHIIFKSDGTGTASALNYGYVETTKIKYTYDDNKKVLSIEYMYDEEYSNQEDFIVTWATDDKIALNSYDGYGDDMVLIRQ